MSIHSRSLISRRPAAAVAGHADAVLDALGGLFCAEAEADAEQQILDATHLAARERPSERGGTGDLESKKVVLAAGIAKERSEAGRSWYGPAVGLSYKDADLGEKLPGTTAQCSK